MGNQQYERELVNEQEWRSIDFLKIVFTFFCSSCCFLSEFSLNKTKKESKYIKSVENFKCNYLHHAPISLPKACSYQNEHWATCIICTCISLNMKAKGHKKTCIRGVVQGHFFVKWNTIYEHSDSCTSYNYKHIKAFGRPEEPWLCPTWLNTVSHFLTLVIYLFRADFIVLFFIILDFACGGWR